MAGQQQQLLKATQFSIYLHSTFSKNPSEYITTFGNSYRPARTIQCVWCVFFHKATVWTDVSVSHQFETGGKISIITVIQHGTLPSDKEEIILNLPDREHDGRGYRLLRVLVKAKVGETKVHKVLDPRNSCQYNFFFQFLLQQLRFSLLITCKHDL